MDHGRFNASNTSNIRHTRHPHPTAHSRSPRHHAASDLRLLVDADDPRAAPCDDGEAEVAELERDPDERGHHNDGHNDPHQADEQDEHEHERADGGADELATAEEDGGPGQRAEGQAHSQMIRRARGADRVEGEWEEGLGLVDVVVVHNVLLHID